MDSSGFYETYHGFLFFDPGFIEVNNPIAMDNSKTKRKQGNQQVFSDSRSIVEGACDQLGKVGDSLHRYEMEEKEK